MITATEQWILEARAEAGAQLLDEKHPGWHQLIDLDQLKMASYRRCILGQLYGKYWAAREALGVDGQGQYDYGFAAVCRDDYPWLDAAWRSEIKKRLDA